MTTPDFILHLVKADLGITDTRNDWKIDLYLQRANARMKVVPRSGKVLYATPNDAFIIPFPDDLAEFVSVSLPVCGELITLTVNKNMPHVKPLNPCTYTSLEELTNSTLDKNCFPTKMSVFPHYRAGNWVGEAYTYYTGHNNAGYVYVDKHNRLFRISGIPRMELCIQYLANERLGLNTLINENAIEPLRYAIHSQLCEFGVGKNLKDATYYQSRSDYFLAKNKLDAFMVSFEQIMDQLIYDHKILKH